MTKLSFLLSLLLLLSCSSVRHYRKVATDTEVTPEKKAIIAPWVSAHFPIDIVYLQGEEIVVVDSTFNQALIDSLIVSIDSLTSAFSKINVDSLKEAIRKECVPKTVYKTRVRVDTVKVPDKALIFTLQRDLETCNGVNASLQEKLNQAQAKIDAHGKKTTNYIIYLVIGLAVIGLQTFLLVKPRK